MKKSMLSRLIMILRFVFIFIVITCSGCGQVEFTFSNGQQKPLDAFKGNWVVVNYWATWCKPCIEEIPELNKLNKHDGVLVFGVNYDGIVGDELIREAKKLGINYDLIVIDPSENIQIKRPVVLPATALIDRNGMTREVLYGPQTKVSITEKIKLLDDG
jgi:thiol-disulfide isomerase/thioredoxin